MKINPPGDESGLLGEIAEVHKRRFVILVEHLARLRDAQYEADSADSVIERAKKVVALNLPSNLLRAAAIFVDWSYGFPPDQGSFGHPEWMTEKAVLPKEQRGLLVCPRFKDLSTLQEKDVVVLLGDLPEHGLHAGMAGIIRELPSEDPDDNLCQIEFGEPQESLTVQVEVPLTLLRRPRPGDLMENYRL
jgi:hypothetical protein